MIRHYIGEDTQQVFINWLKRDVHEIYQKYYQTQNLLKKRNRWKGDTNEKQRAGFVTKKIFTKITKKRDHCHFTGMYRGAAHNNCNLESKRPRFIPLYFHNLAGYEAHLFIRYLGKSAHRLIASGIARKNTLVLLKIFGSDKTEILGLDFLTALSLCLLVRQSFF